jgi:hypothetical protein
MVFDCAFGNVEPKFSPVAPFIAGAGNQLNDFHRSLTGLRRKCARSKLSNLISDFPFLPMQTINASRRLRPRAARRTKSLPRHILPGPPRHSALAGGPVRRIYAELLPQIDARADEGQRRKKLRRRPTRLPARGPPLPPGHVPLRRQNTQVVACLAHEPRTSATRRTPLCRRRATPPPPHCSASPRTTCRPVVYRQQKRKRMAWLRTVGGGGRSASHGPDLRRARERRADEQRAV